MKKYEFFEHTADAKFRAYGKTIEEAFSNAALAMTSVITDVAKVKPIVMTHFSVEGKDLKALLYNFLEEFLFLIDTENFFLSVVKEIRIEKQKGNFVLHATISGDDIKNYETHGDIKAVTYNEMEINEEKGKCMVQVVVDI